MKTKTLKKTLLLLSYVLFINQGYSQEFNIPYTNKTNITYSSDGKYKKEVRHTFLMNRYDSTEYFFSENQKLLERIKYINNDTSTVIFVYNRKGLLQKEVHKGKGLEFDYSYNENDKLILKLKITQNKTDTVGHYNYQNGNLVEEYCEMDISGFSIERRYKYIYKNDLLKAKHRINKNDSILESEYYHYDNQNRKTKVYCENCYFTDSTIYKYGQNDSLLKVIDFKGQKVSGLEEWNYEQPGVVSTKRILYNRSDGEISVIEWTTEHYDSLNRLTKRIYKERQTTNIQIVE